MKTIIVYESKHHGNTYKLVEAIANKNEVDTVNVRNAEIVNLAQYDRIGFASGIAYSKPYKNLMTYAQDNLPANKEVFFVYTCGKQHSKYELPMKELAESRNCKFLPPVTATTILFFSKDKHKSYTSKYIVTHPGSDYQKKNEHSTDLLYQVLIY